MTTIPPGKPAPPARKGSDNVLLGRTDKAVEAKAGNLATQLHRWLQRFARAEAKRQRDAMLGSLVMGRVFKADPPSDAELTRQLWRILTKGGESAFQMSYARTTGTVRNKVPDYAMAEFMRTKQVRLQQIMASVRREVRDSTRQVILTALAEDPRPSTNEIGRRIARVFHGDAGGRPVGVEPAPLINSKVLPTSRVKLDDGGNLYVFSFQRAQLIARTEMAQAENTGIVEGYKASGVKRLRWLAYRDGRSGDREHDKMHRETTAIGVPFVLPDGTPIRYPGDPLAPIKHTANCRCTVRSVLED